jgi:threonylcarbamoyladenosine tRNA methylthiotransferase MtaB
LKKVAFHTLGCKVNQYETQAMGELFEKAGYSIVPDTERADVFVINTCTVTNIGDKKSRQFIRRVKRNNPHAIIAVVGCYSQTAPEEVMNMEGVNIIIGTNERNKIVQLAENCKADEKINIVEDIMKVIEFEEMSINDVKEKTRAFLKIQEGCNQYCTYCIIPYARGPVRSRKKSDIINEVNTLAAGGFKEIVLTGIHIASYGKDLDNQEALIGVLEELNGIEGLSRIRLSSLEPTIFTDDFLGKLKKLPKICEHFHLSLQSGCDKILEKMNRKYTTDFYRRTVERIRKVYPEAALTTDIIVGFPGETEEDFLTTYAFAKEMKFSDIHVFKYSPRKGTPAAAFPEQIDSVTKHYRSEKLISLGEQMKMEYDALFIGKTKEVLIEGENGQLAGYMEGHTENYLKVLVSGSNILTGEIKQVLLKTLKKEYIIGEII